VTTAGLAFGILMIFVDKEARALEFNEITLVHLPALFVALLLARFLGMSADQALDCFPAGIVVQWTVVGLLGGMIWELWRLHGKAEGK
jgi:hypothetical protein